MRIAIGNDHRAYELKKPIIKSLESAGHTVLNFGCDSSDSVDYPDFAAKAVAAITGGTADSGILICGSGIGMSIAANKFPGIRAALCCNAEMAARARLHNDANVLCIGADLVDNATALQIVHSFTTTAFEGGRHQRRLDKIAETERSLLDNK